MTTWTPDTCGCTFNVQDWDNGIATTVANCAAHQGLVDNAHFTQVYHQENKIKNMALSHARDNIPSATTSPPTHCKFCNPYSVSGFLSFDANRNINLKTVNWNASDIAALQDHCDTTYGAGKVTVS